MQTIILQDNSVMEIYEDEHGWNIHWFKDCGFDVNITNLTKQGVEDYIATVMQDMEEYNEQFE